MWKEKYSKFIKDRESLKDILITGINVTLILLALNLLSINLTIAESTLMLASTTYILLGVIIVNLPFKRLYRSIIRRRKTENTSFSKIIIGLVLILLSFILLLVTKIQMLWLASLPLFISGIDITLQGVEKKRKELYLLSVVSFAYALFYILVQTIPVVWYSLQQFSLLFSSATGLVIGKSTMFGPSISGLWIVIVFFIFSVSVFLLTGLKKRHFALNIFGLAISWIIYLIILGFIEFESKSDVVKLQYILFLFCLIPTFFYLIKSKMKYKVVETPWFKDLKLWRLIKSGTVWALVLLLVSGVVLTSFLGADKKTDNKRINIVFYGQNMLGRWDVPEYGKYGEAASGMFGILPYYLKTLGYNSEIIVDDVYKFTNITYPKDENITRYINVTDYMTFIESKTINTDILKDADIFVVINLNKSFSQSELKIIWDFVENGGSLLVLGDHTDIGGIMDPLNDLLQPVGIRYRFDSALPLDYKFRWIPCYHLLHHPVTYKIDSLDEIGISVGASLDINAGSFPMIIGRYGLSDEGDRLKAERAYLGDYEYNPGEQIGDIILAAGAYYGNGKVLVFGDTSSFQNSAISSSLPLIKSVFNWLVCNRTATIEYTQVIISLLLLMGATILYLKSKKNNKIHFVFFPLALCIALIISAVANPIILGKDEIKGNIVYIDISHGERFSLKPYEDDSLTGLMVNLMRNNYLPLILRDFSIDKIENCEILIFNAPTKLFSNREVDAIKQFMNNGGLVILSTGYTDKEASMPLLREFELDIYDIPLGPVPYVEETPEKYQKEPRFVDSWPIIGDIGEDENDTTYPFYSINIDGYEYILMTFTRYGDGGLLLISDSEFLLDKNIESLYEYWPGNIQFLKNIIDEMINKEVLQ